MELLDSKKNIKTKLLKTANLEDGVKLTIEKILEGKYRNRYVVKSYTKRLFLGYKLTEVAAYNIELNFKADKIVKIEYPVFVMVEQASHYLSFVKSKI